MSKLIRRFAGAVFTATLVFAFPVAASAADNGAISQTVQTAPAAQSATAGEATYAGEALGDTAPPEGFRTGDLTDAAPPSADQRPGAQVAWSYHITSSCSGYEGAIRQGANFWGDAQETPSSGTPVECTGGYVQGCGGGGNVVGCNWGMGQRIMLSTIVSDFALLSAHEFGHNWYGHSPAGCANWASAYEVMRPTMC